MKSGIEIAISEKGSELLGGNAEAEFTYRLANTEELKWLETISQNISGIIEFRSMAKFVEGGANERALTQVKAVDNEYPLIGNVQLASGKSFKDVFRQPKSAVMESDLASRLGINIGETFSLGLTKFVLRDIIQSSPDDAGTNFGLGPRTIIKSKDLLDSGLIAPGTLFTAKYRLLIEPFENLDELRALAKIVTKTRKDTPARPRTRRGKIGLASLCGCLLWSAQARRLRPLVAASARAATCPRWPAPYV